MNFVDKAITSSQNDVYREFHSCLTTKGIRQTGLFLVSGTRAVADTLDQFPSFVRSLIVCEERHVKFLADRSTDSAETDALEDLIQSARNLTKKNEPRFSVISLSKDLFDSIDVFGTHAPILVAKTPEIPFTDLKTSPEGLEVLCSLSDPANVGALLRSCAAFGVSKVILLKESANPFHPKAVRSASGTTLMVKFEKGPSVLELETLLERDKSKQKIIALDMFGTDLHLFKWPKNARVLMGEEGLGVPDSGNFERVSIMMAKGVESLNATIASSIALYSYRIKYPLS